MDKVFLIDNVNVFDQYNIVVLDSSGLSDGAKMRINKHVWPDKSGTDVDFENITYDEHSITLKCLLKKATEYEIDTTIETFLAALKTKGLFVFSIRSPFRKSYLCYRESNIRGKMYESESKFIYEFEIKLTVANPNAVSENIDTGAGVSHTFTNTKGPGWIHWGDGTKQFVELSGDYIHEYSSAGKYDIIMDVDKDAETVEPPFVMPDFDADKSNSTFTAIVTKPFTIQMIGEMAGAISTDDKVVIYLNGEIVSETIIPDGTAVNSINIQKTILNITAPSYLKIEYYSKDGFGEWEQKELLFLSDGTFKLENAGASRMSMSGIYYGPFKLYLGNNDIPESDINSVLEKFKSIVVDDNPTAPLVLDISGGTNAVPTSVNAIACKDAMIANGQTYLDNA